MQPVFGFLLVGGFAKKMFAARANKKNLLAVIYSYSLGAQTLRINALGVTSKTMRLVKCKFVAFYL